MALTIPGELFKGASIVDEVSENLTYVGYPTRANPSEASPKWAIKRIQQIGTIIRMEWAEGLIDKKFVWDDRASLTYKYVG